MLTATPPRRASYTTPPGTPTLQRRTCFELFEKGVCPADSPLMKDCSRYQGVQVELQRRNSDVASGLGPRPRRVMLAANPRSDQPELSHADIQRLMMNDSPTW